MFSWIKRVIESVEDWIEDWSNDPEPQSPPKPPVCVDDDENCPATGAPNNPYVPDKYKYNKQLWDTMEYNFIGKQKPSHITWTINKLKKGVAKYKKAARLVNTKTGKAVPWQVIACIHMKEGSGNFDKQVLNGQKWWRKTTWVPKGHGPWESWEKACVTAFLIKNTPQRWTIENTLHFLERFNGMGYAMYRRNIVGFTPYNWAFTNHYKGGYYTSDGKFDRDAIAMGVGLAVILKELGFEG